MIPLGLLFFCVYKTKKKIYKYFQTQNFTRLDTTWDSVVRSVFGVKNGASETTSTQKRSSRLVVLCQVNVSGVRAREKPTTFSLAQDGFQFNDLLRLRFKLYWMFKLFSSLSISPSPLASLTSPHFFFIYECFVIKISDKIVAWILSQSHTNRVVFYIRHSIFVDNLICARILIIFILSPPHSG